MVEKRQKKTQNKGFDSFMSDNFAEFGESLKMKDLERIAIEKKRTEFEFEKMFLEREEREKDTAVTHLSPPQFHFLENPSHDN